MCRHAPAKTPARACGASGQLHLGIISCRGARVAGVQFAGNFGNTRAFRPQPPAASRAAKYSLARQTPAEWPAYPRARGSSCRALHARAAGVRGSRLMMRMMHSLCAACSGLHFGWLEPRPACRYAACAPSTRPRRFLPRSMAVKASLIAIAISSATRRSCTSCLRWPISTRSPL